VNGLRLNCITSVPLRETHRIRSGQVSLRSGQVDFQRTCPTGQVVEKVNVEPCLRTLNNTDMAIASILLMLFSSNFTHLFFITRATF